MKDLIGQALEIDRNLSEKERKEKLCSILLAELRTLKGKELVPYLSEFVLDTVNPGTKIVLRFPIGTHIFDS